MKKFFSIVMATGLMLFFIAVQVQAEPVQKIIPYSKKVPLSFSENTYRFSFWDAETGGNELWSEEKQLKPKGTNLTTDLGDTVSLDSVDFSQQLYVQVEKEKDGSYTVLGTRETFYVAPYAIWATSPSGPKGDKGDTGPAGPQGSEGAQGPTGPQGPKGDTGATGAQGSAGPQGATGPQGPQGATGPQGPRGEDGPAGAQGPKGDTGATGVQGPKGDTGATGPQGDIGLTGPAGPQGPEGPQGLQGLKGDTGAIGMTFKGAWDGAAQYVPTDVVTLGGQTWFAINANQNSEPTPDSLDWTLLAAIGATGPQGPQGDVGPAGAQGPKGDTGATGATGAQGPQGDVGPTGAQGPKGDTGATGAQGPQGDAGATGAQGPQGDVGPAGDQGPKGDTGAVGMTFKGAWDGVAQYVPTDVVTFGGQTWFAINPNQNSEPAPDSLDWTLLAAIGATGPQGPQGDVGPTGAQGPKGDTGATGAQGPQGDVGPTGAQGPKGDTGATGATGPTGPQGPAGIVPVYNNSGTLRTNQHMVTGVATIPHFNDNISVTLSSSAVFTSSTSYYCALQNATDTANRLSLTKDSGTQFTITSQSNAGFGGIAVNYICIGN